LIALYKTIEFTMVIKNFVTLTLINIRFVSVVMIKHCSYRWGSGNRDLIWFDFLVF